MICSLLQREHDRTSPCARFRDDPARSRQAVGVSGRDSSGRTARHNLASPSASLGADRSDGPPRRDRSPASSFNGAPVSGADRSIRPPGLPDSPDTTLDECASLGADPIAKPPWQNPLPRHNLASRVRQECGAESINQAPCGIPVSRTRSPVCGARLMTTAPGEILGPEHLWLSWHHPACSRCPNPPPGDPERAHLSALVCVRYDSVFGVRQVTRSACEYSCHHCIGWPAVVGVAGETHATRRPRHR